MATLKSVNEHFAVDGHKIITTAAVVKVELSLWLTQCHHFENNLIALKSHAVLDLFYCFIGAATLLKSSVIYLAKKSVYKATPETKLRLS